MVFDRGLLVIARDGGRSGRYWFSGVGGFDGAGREEKGEREVLRHWFARGENENEKLDLG
ncbi:hypothetical protein HAX54_033762, partial [Datura stramonium]|nr:hypothetical protein [Datura stramonium]